MSVMRHARLRIAAAVAASLIPSVYAQSLTLKDAQPLPAESGSVIKFNRGESDGPPQPLQSVDLNSMLQVQTPHLDVYADLSSISRGKFPGQIHYQFYIRSGQQLYPMEVTATPIGNFPPQNVNVPFTASMGDAHDEAGNVTLPVFGLYSDQYLTYTPCSADRQNVSLTGETVICLNVASLLSDMDAQVFAIEAKGTNPYWQSVTVQTPSQAALPATVSPVTKGQKTGPPQRIEIHVRPKFYNALTASMAHLKAEPGGASADDQITVDIHYNASISQIPMDLQFSVPIHFYPGLPQLCLFAMVGGLIGAFLRSIPGTSRKSLWKRVKPLLALAAWCILFELLGLWIWTQGTPRTNVVILGFDCNPSQLLPALLMGVVIGLTGLRKLDAAFRRLASSRAGSDDAEPAENPAEKPGTGRHLESDAGKAGEGE